jgi:uncharacterized protein (UPF0333 family)
MLRLLSLLLALLAVAAATYYLVQGTAESGGPSAPKQQIDSMQQKAKQIERDSQKRADELFKKSE